MSEEKPKKSLKVSDFFDADQLRKDLAYSTADLSSSMAEQAAMFAHYGVLAAKASLQTDKFKMLADNTEAAVSRIIRDEKALKGEKVTEAQITSLVIRHPRVVDARRAVNEAKQIEAVGKIAVESFRHRRDMLVQQGLISREEMKGELSVSMKNIKEEQLEESKGRMLERRANRQAGKPDEE